MLKNLTFIALTAVAAVGIGYANQSTPDHVVVKVTKVPANDGRQMYVSYCAPCHGLDGRGQGPVAPALKRQPTNLALLSKNNGGKFPASHVVSILQFGSANPAHGTAEMPVWGHRFAEMDATLMPQSDVRMLRISNLSAYLRSLQEK